MAQQRAGELEHRRREHPRVQVDHVVERAPDRVADARVVVADRRADLAGGEVEHPPPARGLDERAGRAHDRARRRTRRRSGSGRRHPWRRSLGALGKIRTSARSGRLCVSMRSAETLLSALVMPASVGLLGLILAILAWLDDGEYRRPDKWTTWRSPSATRPPRAASTRTYFGFGARPARAVRRRGADALRRDRLLARARPLPPAASGAVDALRPPHARPRRRARPARPPPSRRRRARRGARRARLRQRQVPRPRRLHRRGVLGARPADAPRTDEHAHPGSRSNRPA